MNDQEILVQPFGGSTPQKLRLSTWDQVFARMVTPRFQVFNVSSQADKKTVVDALTHGLSQALAQFPELSGRVEDEDSTRDTSKIVIDNDSGVPFKIRDFSEGSKVPWTLEEFAKRGYPPSMIHQAAVFGEYSFDVQKSPCPVLTAQFSFIRGGAVLFVTYLRRVLDGEGCMPLMQAWARYTAAAFSRHDANETTIEPIISDRNILSVRAGGASKGVTLSDFPEFQLIDPNEGFKLTAPSNDTNSTANETHTVRPSPPIISCPILRLSPSKQSALLAATGLIDIDESISALIWLFLARARLSAATSSSTSAASETPSDPQHPHSSNSDLGIGISLRPRLNSPPLPSPHTYTGSATYRIGTTSTLAAIAALSLPEAAERIRAAFASFDESRFRGLLRCVDELDNMSALQPRHRLHEGPHLYINLQGGFGEREMEWGGCLGKPVAVREVFVPIEGYAVVLPRCRDGGSEVMVSLGERTRAALMMMEEEFVEFMELVGG